MSLDYKRVAGKEGRQEFVFRLGTGIHHGGHRGSQRFSRSDFLPELQELAVFVDVTCPDAGFLRVIQNERLVLRVCWFADLEWRA